jgi:SAM-dependent methyltransferase
MTAVKSYYDERWSSEDQYDRPPTVGRVRIVGDTVESVLANRPGRVRVLDVGCGNGWVLAELERRFGNRVELFGVEPSGCGAENSSERVPSANIVCGTLATVSYSRQFDLAVTSEVIEHVEDQRAFAEEIAAVLKPDGTVVLSTPNGAFLKGYFEDNLEYDPQPIENWLRIVELENLFSDLFDIRSIRTFNPEYFYDQHSMLSFVRKAVQALPGGRHIRCRLDRLVWRDIRAGLNLLAVFDRKADV